jgi:hypothetical protein
MVVKALETITLARVDDGTPGSQDVPMTYVQTAQPTGKIVKDSIWWVGDSMKTATALKRWNGSAWVPDTIAQAVLNILELNAITVHGSMFNGSTFNSTFANVQPDGFAYKMHGTSTLASGALITDAYNDANVQVSHTELNQTGLIARGFSNGQKLAEINVGQGMMSLGAVYNPTGNSGVWVTGTLTAAKLLAMMRSGLLAWQGTLYPQVGDVATMSINLDQTFSGWLVEWQYYNSGKQDSHYNYTLVPNIWPTYHTGKDLMIQLSMPGVGTFFKQLIVTNTQITGVAANNSGSQSPKAVMSRVFAV